MIDSWIIARNKMQKKIDIIKSHAYSKLCTKSQARNPSLSEFQISHINLRVGAERRVNRLDRHRYKNSVFQPVQ